MQGGCEFPTPHMQQKIKMIIMMIADSRHHQEVLFRLSLNDFKKYNYMYIYT